MQVREGNDTEKRLIKFDVLLSRCLAYKRNRTSGSNGKGFGRVRRCYEPIVFDSFFSGVFFEIIRPKRLKRAYSEKKHEKTFVILWVVVV